MDKQPLSITATHLMSTKPPAVGRAAPGEPAHRLLKELLHPSWLQQALSRSSALPGAADAPVRCSDLAAMMGTAQLLNGLLSPGTA